MAIETLPQETPPTRAVGPAPARMRPLAALDAASVRGIRYLLTDIDDTLTTDGHLEAAAYGALERLRDGGIQVIPVTGRPAGWCDHIARMWPVTAVVGENGAFWFRYDRARKRMRRCHWSPPDDRRAARAKLDALAGTILAAVPGCAIAADQAYREADLAIDFAEDVAPLSDAAIDRIVALFAAAGATAKVSSIHVNGWFGDWDKLGMAQRLLEHELGCPPEHQLAAVAYAGDSPNDQPMFAHFPLSIGVANVRRYLDRLTAPPAFVTTREAGAGFVEIANHLLGS